MGMKDVWKKERVEFDREVIRNCGIRILFGR
jgi:hypothetical protein